MASIFSKIVEGKAPSYKVAETNRYLAFLDVHPLVEGHVLVIPKKEVDELFSLDEELYLGLMGFAKEVAGAIKRSIRCKRVGMAVIGLEVPHAHVHLVPLHYIDDMNFNKKKLSPSNEELEETARAIRGALNMTKMFI